MDDFTKYEALRDKGATPDAIDRAAQADGVDAITRLRLLRNVCGLSLADAKRAATGGDAFGRKQDVRVGTTVYWESVSPADGLSLMQARVTRIEGDTVFVNELRRFRPTPCGLEETPIPENGAVSVPLRSLDKTLAERLGEAMAAEKGGAVVNRR